MDENSPDLALLTALRNLGDRFGMAEVERAARQLADVERRWREQNARS